VVEASNKAQRADLKAKFIQTDRLVVDYLFNPAEISSDHGEDVIAGLLQTPKTLPAKYFYDDRGSKLFEQICDLPEYYLTRTETAILHEHAAIIAHYTGACELVELGSGSSTKTRLLLSAYEAQGLPLVYRPIDISASMLEASAQQLLQAYPKLKIQALVGTYERALEHLTNGLRLQRMVCFLGSTLGNLTPTEVDRFFDRVTAALNPGEYFLLGVDRHKATAQLEAAYNDSQGVTAAFNLNVLHHLNQRFNGNFDPERFEHWAFYNETQRQIEMHLRSRSPQIVQLQRLGLSVEFAAGETIRTEISRKFELASLQQQLQTKGLELLHTWTDPHDWFMVLLCQLRPATLLAA